MIRRAIPAYLLTKNGITALVGQRVYPAREPQKERKPGQDPADVYPCLVFRKLSRKAGRQYGNDGPADNTAWIQIESVARTYAAAQEVREQVLAAMEALPALSAGVSMASAQLLDDWDENEDEVGAADEAIYVAVQIFEVLYADPAE